jgi:hypothetical protein
MGLEMEQKSLHGKRVPFPKKDMTRNGRWPVNKCCHCQYYYVSNISKGHRSSFGDHGALERSPDRPPFGPFWTSLFVGHGNTDTTRYNLL